MDADLKALEEKITQLVQLCKSLRENNLELGHSLAISQERERQLKARMHQAQIRIANIIDRLPEEVYD
jgi:cell division protein ZapB